MTNERPSAAQQVVLDHAIATAWHDRRQADVVTIPTLPVISDDGAVRHHPSPDGVVLLSQTCDIVRDERLTVVVGPLCRLEEPERSQAREGKRPRYVAVPELGEDAFVDLDVIGTVDKGELARTPVTKGVDPTNDEQVRDFAAESATGSAVTPSRTRSYRG